MSQVVESIYAGTNSDFDSPWWPEAIPVLPSETGYMRAMVTQHIVSKTVRIPRMLRLLRNLALRPENPNLRSKAEVLARSLYHYDNALHPSLLDKRPASHDHGNRTTNPYADASSGSSRRLVITLMYEAYRVLICGAIQNLRSIDANLLLDIDLEAVQLEDVEAARRIAVTAKLALAPSPDVPWLALRVITPLLISYGTWHRIEQRLQVTNCTQHPSCEASVMKAECSDMLNRALMRWNRNNQVFPIEKTALVFAGGPLLPEMSSRNVDWEKVLRDGS
ncbi:hypothetical protein MBLNU13_g02107t1 [Cladosporium sp. NU13]